MRADRVNPSSALWLGALILMLIMIGFVLSLALFGSPVQAQVIFATNTPPAPDPLEARPDAPIDQYALRLWGEQDLINVLISQLNRLADGEEAQIIGAQLTQYELQQRFPGAPHDEFQRERLLRAMLSAPRGSVDMRTVVRPFILSALNARRDEFAAGTTTSGNIGGFSIAVMPFNLDGIEPVDALLEIRYPAEASDPASVQYEDFVILQSGTQGGYLLPSGISQLPAGPFNTIIDVALGRAGDLNLDNLDELGVIVNTGQVNQEMFVYGWRNGSLVSLILPGERILFGEIRDWPFNQDSLLVANYHLESPVWSCLSALEITWSWSANFLRPSTAEGVAYANLDTVGCRLHEAEPIFAQPATEGIDLVSGILADSDDPNEAGVDRGRMALAMLYLLNSQPRSAQEQIDLLTPLAENNDWLAGQIDAFAATSGDNVAPIEVCAALIAQAPNGACNVDQVLARMFIDNPLVRAEPLVPQLESLGLPVLEVVTVSQVGRADREVVNFNLTGASWWEFAPTSPEFYVPAPTTPPVNFGETSLPAGLVEAPAAAYDALLVDNDPVGALNLLDNAARANPDVPLAASAHYFEALIFDLTGDRQAARQAYYDLWIGFPDSPWGALAGAHLERR